LGFLRRTVAQGTKGSVKKAPPHLTLQSTLRHPVLNQPEIPDGQALGQESRRTQANKG